MLLASSCLIAESEEVPVLRVLNWSEYLSVDPKVDDGLAIEEKSYALREFSKEFGCKVEYYEYEETTEAFSRIDKNEGFYDVVVASSGEVVRMIEGGYVEPLDKVKIPNYRYVSLFYDDLESQRDIWNYAMPYLYGTTGIAFRSDLVSQMVTGLDQFFDPEFSPDVKRAILNDSQVMFGLVSIMLGNDPNTNRRGYHSDAAKTLHRLKSANLIDTISTSVELLGEKLVNGEIGFAIMYSGDALGIAEEESNIEYIIPSEGAEYYIDSFVIPSSSKNKELAHSFLNFMLRPDINARESMELLFPTLNLAALSIVEKRAPDQLLDENIYPLPETVRGLHEFSMRSASLIQYWHRFLNEN
ncbi:spermidine/putrescine ABC transporter substrate-binding protein [Puniceicoccaceae bacterium K14]|nr:spermidine/putrescine ABC transporter substrate-binding protein [Puniceicoccaceae bacterium K14]